MTEPVPKTRNLDALILKAPNVAPRILTPPKLKARVMEATPDMNRCRRTLLQSALILPAALAAGGGLAPKAALAVGADQAAGVKDLVVYFSRSGNTRVIAGQISRARAARLVEITPATPYPEDYEATVAQAARERESGYLPPLTGRVGNIADYDRIWLGFPIWGGSAPPVIRAFLSGHDLTGKTVIPFITHGGYGIGNSLDVVAQDAPSASFAAPFVLEADQERRTLARVTSWLGQI